MTSPPATGTTGLVLSGLTRRHGSLTAVEDVGLHLPPGARHAVIGPNGAGKTTLLDLVAGAIAPHRGTVTLDGHDLTRAGPARRSRFGIARSFQRPALADEVSVLDHLVLAAWHHHPRRRGAWRNPARHCAVRAYAAEQAAAVGLGDALHTRAGALPHGRRRLLDVAAALASRPRVLLLDEPAAGLTDDELALLPGLLDELADGVSILLVEHHTEVIGRLAGTVTVLVEGRTLLTAPTAQALEHPAVRAAYLGLPEETPPRPRPAEGDTPCSNSTP